MDFNIPEDASPEFKDFLANESNAAAIKAMIESAKSPLVSKRDELLAKQTELNKRLEGLGGLDKLAALHEQATAAEEARRKAEQDALEKNGNVEQLKKLYGDQLSAKDKELSDLKASILAEKKASKINSAIREAKGVPELLSPAIINRVQATMVDGELKLTVLTASGLPMLKDDGKEASIKDLISELRASPVYQRAFEATAASGTGGKESTAAGVVNPWNPATKNVTEQMRLYRQDKAQAQRLAAEFNVTLR